LSDLTHNEIYDALTKAGLKPTNHFIKRLKDIRTPNLGVETLRDLEQFFSKGMLDDAGDGLLAMVHGKLAVVFDPATKALVTIRPWD
jgi:hypothetical protein